MQIENWLIEKFLNNRCNAEEAKLVHQYLIDHPELLQQRYRQEWDKAGAEGALNSEHTAAMYKAINERTSTRKNVVVRFLPRAAAAAVVIFAFSIWLYQPTGQHRKVPAQIATVNKATQPLPPGEQWCHRQNTTKKALKMDLPDGSVVSLSPAAMIKYRTVFEPQKREIILEGDALFDVVKDKARPFTVYSGDLSTTALGTTFRVTTSPVAVSVQLLTGKVVVRAVKQSLPGWKKDVFLLPGQQMRYDAASRLLTVTGKHEAKQPQPAPVHDPGAEMVFENAPLKQVFDKLSQHYKTPIAYNAEELNGLGFSGTVFYKDSLPVILQVIARMNDLSLTTVPDGFCIKKAHKE